MAQSTTLSPAPPKPQVRKAPASKRWLGRVFHRLFRIGASLQLAVTLLSVFTICLILATLLESSYSATLARDLIYRTWWFTGLLTLLAINILFAALKKFPWKRHQTGFLITHLGLITIVAGGLITNLGGSEGVMSMIDSDNEEIQMMFRMSNTTDTMQLVDQHEIEVLRIPIAAHKDEALIRAIFQVMEEGREMSDLMKEKLEGNYWTMRYWPGSLPWKDDEYFRAELPWSLRLLRTLADPNPGFGRQLDDKVSLNVENYYTHTDNWPFSPTEDGKEGMAALHLSLSTPMMPNAMTRWITNLPTFMADPIPLQLDMMVLNDPDLLAEFLNPPSAEEMGKQGTLVLHLKRYNKRLEVALDKLDVGKSMRVPDTDLTLTLMHVGDYMSIFGHGRQGPGQAPVQASNPSVLIELAGPERKEKAAYAACARMPHLRPCQTNQDHFGVSLWYHHPDFRWGQKDKMGAIQFLRAPGNHLYYRVYGKDGLKGEGKALDPESGEEIDLPWEAMKMRFKVVAFLPNAMVREYVVPESVEPGAEMAENYQPGIRFTLTNGNDRKEAWARMSPKGMRVAVGKNLFYVRYRIASQKMDFKLKLKRARQINDPGSERPASFESEVALTRTEDGQEVTTEHKVFMNHTLDHAKYKMYQTDMKPMAHPETGQMVLGPEDIPVTRSSLTIGHDPGLMWKYVGSGLLVLGIATMFYMRAYFFKPRKRPATM